MSEKYKAKWTGTDPQKVPGIGRFEPNKEIEISKEQADILRGVNDARYVINAAVDSSEVSSSAPKKEKSK